MFTCNNGGFFKNQKVLISVFLSGAILGSVTRITHQPYQAIFSLSHSLEGCGQCPVQYLSKREAPAMEAVT